MPKSTTANPFVTKFLQPIISQELKMLLLRYEYDDGSKGCIGIREEAMETLCSVFAEVLQRLGK